MFTLISIDHNDHKLTYRDISLQIFGVKKCKEKRKKSKQSKGFLISCLLDLMAGVIYV